MEETTKVLRRLMQEEVERLLGFPCNHTAVSVANRYNNYDARIL
jgi:hypothetical protein